MIFIISGIIIFGFGNALHEIDSKDIQSAKKRGSEMLNLARFEFQTKMQF